MVNFFIMPPRNLLLSRLVVSASADLLRGSARSFGQDARLWAQAIHPPINYIGREQLPDNPCVITINHYSRPGFPAWRLVLGVSAAVREEIHWLITSAWTFPGRSWAKAGERVSRIFLKRLARMYAFSSMPPMPPRPEESQTRAEAVRRLIESSPPRADRVDRDRPRRPGCTGRRAAATAFGQRTVFAAVGRPGTAHPAGWNLRTGGYLHYPLWRTVPVRSCSRIITQPAGRPGQPGGHAAIGRASASLFARPLWRAPTR